MTTAIIHNGKKGNLSRNGTNGLGVSDIRYSLIASPVIDAFKQNKLSENVFWYRDGEASFEDRYGNSQKKAGFNIFHAISNSDDFRDTGVNTYEWLDPDNVWTLTGDRNQPDPLGGTQASRITFTSTTGQTQGLMGYSGLLFGIFRVSLYVKVVSGTLNKISYKQGFSGGTIDFPQTPSNVWQRFSVIYPDGNGSEARFLFDAPSGCVVDIFRVNSTEGTMLHDPALIGDVPFIEIPSGESLPRQNDKGYLIQSQSQNKCSYSQDLNNWDVTGQPTIGQSASPDPFGDEGTNSLVTFTGSSIVTITQNNIGGGLVEGQVYAVSFWAYLESGQFDSLTVSLGGSAADTVEITSKKQRFKLFLTAGVSDNITFTATSGLSGTSFNIFGVQVEENFHTGYIYTELGQRNSSSDVALIRKQNWGVDLRKPFTLMFSVNDAEFLEGEQAHVITTTNGFRVTLEFNTNRRVVLYTSVSQSVNMITDDDVDLSGDAEVTIVYNGTSARFFFNGVFVRENLTLNFESGLTDELIIGASNINGDNALNAYIQSLRVWDFALTDNEVKYASQADTTNRYKDRG